MTTKDYVRRFIPRTDILRVIITELLPNIARNLIIPFVSNELDQLP